MVAKGQTSFYNADKDTYTFRGQTLVAREVSSPGRLFYDSGSYILSSDDGSGRGNWCVWWDDDPGEGWTVGEGPTPEEALCALDKKLKDIGV